MPYKPRKGASTSKVSRRAPKGVSRKAAKHVQENKDKPVAKRFGKAVMRDNPNSKTGGKIGYASVAPTKTGKYKPRKATTKQGRAANKKARKSY